MKRIVFAVLIVSALTMVSCAPNPAEEAILTYDHESEVLQTAESSDEIPETSKADFENRYDAITAALYDELPELDQIAAFIGRQSGGRAGLIVEVSTLIEQYQSEEMYYPVYVGEEWDDGHRAGWYRFYFCETSGEILADSFYRSTDLLSWRAENSYLRRMDLIQDALSDDGDHQADLDSWQMHVIYDSTRYSRTENNSSQLLPGDMLVTLAKNNTGMYTFWDKLYSQSDKSSESGMVCFQSDDELTQRNLVNPDGQLNLVESKEAYLPEVIAAYNDFLSGRSFVLYDGNLRYVEDIMTDDLGSRDRKYTLYDVDEDGIPELILQGRRLYILSYIDGEAVLLFCDEHYGGSSYFVNGGGIYERHGGIANQISHAYDELQSDGASRYRVVCYAYSDGEEIKEMYTYREDNDEDETEISKNEYDTFVENMSNDDEIPWQQFYYQESTLTSLH